MNYRLRASLVLAYLAAIVAANLLTTHFARLGHPEASVYTAFALVAFDLVARDLLHDWFAGRRRLLVLGVLILAGSLLSYVANPASSSVAKWSALAFAAAMLADGVVYALARRRPWAERSNLSNVVGALADSVVFCAGLGFPVVVAFGQFTAKVAGGALLVIVIAAVKPRARWQPARS